MSEIKQHCWTQPLRSYPHVSQETNSTRPNDVATIQFTSFEFSKHVGRRWCNPSLNSSWCEHQSGRIASYGMVCTPYLSYGMVHHHFLRIGVSYSWVSTNHITVGVSEYVLRWDFSRIFARNQCDTKKAVYWRNTYNSFQRLQLKSVVLDEFSILSPASWLCDRMLCWKDFPHGPSIPRERSVGFFWLWSVTISDLFRMKRTSISSSCLEVFDKFWSHSHRVFPW